MKSRAAAVIAPALVLVLCAGCAPSHSAARSATTTPTPTASAPAFDSDHDAYAAAEKTYREYVEALNDVNIADPGTFGDVFAWETDKQYVKDRKALSRYHAEAMTVSGESRITLVTPLGRQLNPDVVSLAACLDVSRVDLADEDGNSHVSTTRPDVQSLTLDFLPSDSTPTGLALAAISGREGEPTC